MNIASRTSARANVPHRATGEQYDLIVANTGSPDLRPRSTARTRLEPHPRLDNHDDFGGHAERDEFDLGNLDLGKRTT